MLLYNLLSRKTESTMHYQTKHTIAVNWNISHLLNIFAIFSPKLCNLTFIFETFHVFFFIILDLLLVPASLHHLEQMFQHGQVKPWQLILF